MQSNKKVLVISHDASRTGAPILLINLIELLKEEGYVIDILLKRGGEIEDDFAALGPTQIFYKTETRSFGKRIKTKLKSFLHIKEKRPYTSEKYRFILNNTIVNGDIISHYNNAPVITYVHELKNVVFNSAHNKAGLAQVLDKTSLFIYPSTAVKSFLTTELNIQNEKVCNLPYYVKDQYSQKQKLRQALRDNLQIQEGQIVIGGIGTTGWRKGSDFFLMLANKFKGDDRFKFLWVGSDVTAGNKAFKEAAYDKEMLGLDNLELIASEPNAWQYLAAMDIFFLTSREDPYPLVVLEAAMMDLTIACFEKSGGANEFVANGNGVELPYLNLQSSAEFLEDYFINNKPYKIMAKRARNKYTLMHSKEIVLQKLRLVLNEFIK